jgi:factor associated with neutral sphingomyelinase activation
LNNLSFDDQNAMTLRWQNGLISNFDYIMYLNFIADRSFNDLTQYPVFPWVIADYTSDKLDLNGDHTNTFRDLSKPIGALNEKRLKRMQDRFKEMPDPKFLYGTHYSTPGYVLYYLIRQAPEYMLRLQSGKFDAPDRIFNSIAQTWTAVLENDADVKELIPEFYQSTGEFLLNTLQLDLGTKHNGQRVNNIVLPPWAENEKDFIYKNRLALESDYVSDNLHHWIDLIFGYKQRGVEAVKANNLFYYLTYEGAVDINKITDPMERHSIEMQIREFGQTPKQVFTQPHPKRRAGTDVSKITLSDLTSSNTIRLDPISATRSSLDVPDTAVTPKHRYTRSAEDFGATLDSIGLSGSGNSSPFTSPMTTTPSSTDKSTTDEDDENFDDLLQTNFSRTSAFARRTNLPSKLITNLENKADSRPSSPSSPLGRRARIGLSRGNSSTSLSTSYGTVSVPKYKRIENLELSVATKLHQETIGSAIIIPSDNRVYTASHDACVKIYSLESKRQLRRIADMGDMALSSCVILPASLTTSESKVLIVSSWDNKIYAYSIEYGRILDTVSGHEDAVAKVSIHEDTLMSCSWDGGVKLWKCISTGFSKVPIMEFTEHQTPVQTCNFDATGNLAVSASEDGEIAVYDLRQRKLAHSFNGHFDAVRDVCFLGGDSRRIISCSKDQTIKIFEVNGSEVYSFNAKESLRCIVTDGDVIYSGGDSGMLKMWDAKDGAFLGEKDAHSGSAITCINLAPDGTSLITGAKNGCLNYYK